MTDGGGKLWFAPSLPDFTPGIPFRDVDLSGDNLPQQFRQRIRGYYLEPSFVVARAGYTFASGLILVSCIDALARFQSDNKLVGLRFCRWTASELSSFKDEEVNRRFYEDFRNGLVHEARIKNGGKFSSEQRVTVVYEPPILSISPQCLSEEVEQALSNFVSRLEADKNLRAGLVKKVRSDFECDFKYDGSS